MIRRLRSVSFVAIVGTLLPVAVPAAEPVNPETNAKARAVLNYLEKLLGRQEKRLVSGQFAGFGSGASLKACQAASEKTGHWPAIIGLDYAEFRTGGLETRSVNRLAIEYARKGGLVAISAHLYNPASPKRGGLRDKGVNLETLLDPVHENHRRWMEELDTLAAGLRELQDAGVVVQWRPFHEMNGGWFWWGGKDPEAFIRVWRHMFDHFTKTRKLNNLLWVYGPNHGKKTAAYYAGDRYVDIVGLDAYTDFVDPKHVLGYPEVARLPKPFGFTEFGPHGPQNPPGDYDYLRFRDGIEANFPRTVFWLSWDDKWGLGRNVNTKALLEHPWVVNREDLPGEFAARR
jgi:mannan endo-1,4-beta-mannosidase